MPRDRTLLTAADLAILFGQLVRHTTQSRGMVVEHNSGDSSGDEPVTIAVYSSPADAAIHAKWLQQNGIRVQIIGGIVLHEGKIAEMRVCTFWV